MKRIPAVVGMLGLVVLALVGALAIFLPSDDPLIVALVTLVAFALFDPLRHRVQTFVDRQFNQPRHDVRRVVDTFAGSLQKRVAPEDLVEGGVEVVSTTMQPAAVGVWVRETP